MRLRPMARKIAEADGAENSNFAAVASDRAGDSLADRENEE